MVRFELVMGNNFIVALQEDRTNKLAIQFLHWKVYGKWKLRFLLWMSFQNQEPKHDFPQVALPLLTIKMCQQEMDCQARKTTDGKETCKPLNKIQREDSGSAGGASWLFWLDSTTEAS